MKKFNYQNITEEILQPADVKIYGNKPWGVQVHENRFYKSIITEGVLGHGESYMEVLGVTVSKEQVKLGKKLCEGLPVEFRLMDYRDIDGKFDRIVSVGMIEHVGYKNYRIFFKTANRCLKDDELFLLHTIGNNIFKREAYLWTHKYIFPYGMLPSIAQLAKQLKTFS